MTRRDKRNHAASIAHRLLAQSRTTGQIHDLVLRRFAMEQVLARVAASDHCEKFILKGAMVYVAWGLSIPRPTKDMDLLSLHAAEPDQIREIFKELLRTETEGEALRFDAESLVLDRIKRDDPHLGVRVRVTATLDR